MAHSPLHPHRSRADDDLDGGQVLAVMCDDPTFLQKDILSMHLLRLKLATR